jgi:hypothetical protein
MPNNRHQQVTLGLAGPQEQAAPGLHQWSRTQTIDLTQASGWLRRAVGKIEEIAALDDNWDGHGSRKVSETAITGAYYLVSILDQYHSAGYQLPPTYIVPSRDGGIQVEWNTPTKHLEIEALSLGGGEFLATGDDGFDLEGKIDLTNSTAICMLANWLNLSD